MSADEVHPLSISTYLLIAIQTHITISPLILHLVQPFLEAVHTILIGGT